MNLKIEGLTFSYKRSQPAVLRDVSLEIDSGGIYGLLGKNGVGKTTLLHLMSGVLYPQKGSVEYDGADVCQRRPSVLSEVFIMPDEVSFPSMKLSEYVKVNSPFYPRFSHEEMNDYLSMFGISDAVNLGELSMGQKKKAYMSFALACNTSFLFMDEPTNGLDIPAKEIFRRLVAGCAADERAIIISTHQVRDVESMFDHVIIMDDAKIVFNHSMSEIGRYLKFEHTDSPETVKSALMAIPTVGGISVVSVNENGDETDVDIEMLFNLVTSNYGAVAYAFRNSKSL